MKERLEALDTCTEEPLGGAAPPGQVVLGKGMGNGNCSQCKAEALERGPLNRPGRTESHRPAPSLQEVPVGFPGAKKMVELAYCGSKSPSNEDNYGRTVRE